MKDSLTLNQELQFETIKRSLPRLSRDNLERFLLQLIKQNYFYKNTCSQLMKKELGIDDDERTINT